MSEQTIHITAPLSREDLDALVAGLEAACGGNHIVVTEVFDLIVEDKRQVAALEALFGEIDKYEDVRRKAKVKKAPSPASPTAGARSYIIEGTGEVISFQALNKRMGAGEIEVGTILVKKGGIRYTVVTDDLGLTLEEVQA